MRPPCRRKLAKYKAYYNTHLSILYGLVFYTKYFYTSNLSEYKAPCASFKQKQIRTQIPERIRQCFSLF